MTPARIAALAVAAFAVAGCTDERGAILALDAAGYTSIQIGGYAWWDCDQKDQFRTRFTATGPTGKRVTGAVCSGWLKGYTIRITGAAR